MQTILIALLLCSCAINIYFSLFIIPRLKRFLQFTRYRLYRKYDELFIWDMESDTPVTSTNVKDLNEDKIFQ